MWKKAAVAQLKVLSYHLPGGTEVNMQTCSYQKCPGQHLHPQITSADHFSMLLLHQLNFITLMSHSMKCKYHHLVAACHKVPKGQI